MPKRKQRQKDHGREKPNDEFDVVRTREVLQEPEWVGGRVDEHLTERVPIVAVLTAEHGGLGHERLNDEQEAECPHRPGSERPETGSAFAITEQEESPHGDGETKIGSTGQHDDDAEPIRDPPFSGTEVDETQEERDRQSLRVEIAHS